MRIVIAIGGSALLRQRDGAESSIERWPAFPEVPALAQNAANHQLRTCYGYGSHLNRSETQACAKSTQAAGRPAAIGALSDASDPLAGRAGITESAGTGNEVTGVAS
jgi:hypothetical protein